MAKITKAWRHLASRLTEKGESKGDLQINESKGDLQIQS